MEYPERIQRCIDYIESHLTEPLSIEEIARQAFLSAAHLYRIFPYLTGLTVGRYIRKRRLTASSYALCHTRRRIIDIAFDFLFQSQESYIRAFKSAFGITPGEYRKTKMALALFHPLRLYPFSLKGGVMMKPSMITKRFLLAGYEAEIDLRFDFTETMNQLRGKLKLNLNRIGGKFSPIRVIGIWQPFDPGGGEENMAKRIYFTGIEIANAGDIPEDFIVKDLPESLFACFREKQRGEISGGMYTQWLPASGFILNEDLMCDLEIFDGFERCGGLDECDIFLPVRPHDEV
ncbi:MAG: AraC family transcriptional regulator [Clostridiales bacterium]|jgi:AraC family transcriptional regulator|nr:AraC family transcriptional regulator [Clostridiales bacterium]